MKRTKKNKQKSFVILGLVCVMILESIGSVSAEDINLENGYMTTEDMAGNDISETMSSEMTVIDLNSMSEQVSNNSDIIKEAKDDYMEGIPVIFFGTAENIKVSQLCEALGLETVVEVGFSENEKDLTGVYFYKDSAGCQTVGIYYDTSESSEPKEVNLVEKVTAEYESEMLSEQEVSLDKNMYGLSSLKLVKNSGRNVTVKTTKNTDYGEIVYTAIGNRIADSTEQKYTTWTIDSTISFAPKNNYMTSAVKLNEKANNTNDESFLKFTPSSTVTDDSYGFSASFSGVSISRNYTIKGMTVHSTGSLAESHINWEVIINDKSIKKDLLSFDNTIVMTNKKGAISWNASSQAQFYKQGALFGVQVDINETIYSFSDIQYK